IIMLTAKSSEESKINGLNIGADDYLIKPFSPRELVARVKAILRRARQETQTKTVKYEGGLSIDYETPAVYKNGFEIALTPNEFKILAFISRTPGRYFSREQLIENALGSDFDGYDRAVDSHIKNLRQKIESNPKSPVYIVTQYGFGYKFGGIKK
ncbi:MAG: response regulator transcription factor, partial [Deferribacterales bacterium]|nr:response regulator transcription factor [Deferribacterales bacterium]